MLHGKDHTDTHVSDNRWRHQESRSYARHAAQGPREADERHGSKDLANFLNASRVEPPQSVGSGTADKHKPITVAENVHSGGARHAEGGSKGDNILDSCIELEVKCGPLLNYRRMENETWFGSVLIVTKGGGLGGGPEPQLIWKTTGNNPVSGAGALPSQKLPAENGGIASSNGSLGEPHGTVNGVDCTRPQNPAASSQVPGNTNVTNDTANGTTNGAAGFGEIKVPGTKLYSDPSNTFWRFDLQIPMQQFEIQCDYSIPGLKFTHGTKTDKQSFFIPAISESMRIMFHSCNGFSVGTDEDGWSGAALWNDVMRVHQKTPFHVM